MALMMVACGNDEPNNEAPIDNEQNKEIPSESQNDLKVTINDDGTTSNGISFAPIDGTSFYLDHIKYQIVESHLEVTGYDAIEISEKTKIYGQVSYRGIVYNTRIIRSYSFSNCEKIKNIIISEGITEIGNRAFSQCCSLSSVSLPKTLKTIENGTFNECRSLESIVIPEGVTKLAAYSFSQCNSLTSVSFGKATAV